ncbi:DNA (cytosine-5-)-methyltransferase [Gemmiger formicilis]|uniref:DNA (cytosine-5-)-methyltransferase n=1 Tax=Gemmiger formicilis TaxID=745368 RepID=UPI00195C230F|nr:DNA (cytosine-5-)-methyltransferase [Gemmiger formicilis]MBM6715871.1 DNA (cytosine-5-)-methyltransferase [Gemmiger formicilis]
MRKTIHYIDMFAGMGGFREGLTRAGNFICMGHCEIDKYADRSYCALFDTEGEWSIADARKADPETMPDFELLCGGFPCQAFSLAGNRRGFGDPRGTLFFELARLAEARKPRYLLFENVPGLLSHDGGRTFATILHTLDRLGYGVEWQVLNSKDFGVPQSRRRVYLVGYLDARCRGKILPFTTAAGNALAQVRPGTQEERIYSLNEVSRILAAQAGSFGGRTIGVPVKEEIWKGRKIAHTLTTGSTQGTPCFIDMNRETEITEIARCLTAKQTGGIHNHKREASGVLYNGRIRRLTPRECLRLQGWTDDRIDKVLAIQSDNQVYKQAGNGVTVNVVEAIGRRMIELESQIAQR